MIEEAVQRIQSLLPSTTAPLVGISGIDASGKGYTTRQVELALAEKGIRAANINIDGWLSLPTVRFNEETPALTFYEKGIRFDEMFEKLVLPLKRDRKIYLKAPLLHETDTEYYDGIVDFPAVDVILLEGVFLFQPRFLSHFDLKCWVECSFETALQRALQRGQEGLPPAETIAAFNKIYFPAQRIHFERDNPQKVADLIIDNNTAPS